MFNFFAFNPQNNPNVSKHSLNGLKLYLKPLLKHVVR